MVIKRNTNVAAESASTLINNQPPTSEPQQASVSVVDRPLSYSRKEPDSHSITLQHSPSEHPSPRHSEQNRTEQNRPELNSCARLHSSAWTCRDTDSGRTAALCLSSPLDKRRGHSPLTDRVCCRRRSTAYCLFHSLV